MVNLAQDFHSFAQCLLWARRHRMRVLLAPDRQSATAVLGSLSPPAPSCLFFEEDESPGGTRPAIPCPDAPSTQRGRRRVKSLPRGRIALWSSGTTQSPGLHFKSWSQLLESVDAIDTFSELGQNRFLRDAWSRDKGHEPSGLPSDFLLLRLVKRP